MCAHFACIDIRFLVSTPTFYYDSCSSYYLFVLFRVCCSQDLLSSAQAETASLRDDRAAMTEKFDALIADREIVIGERRHQEEELQAALRNVDGLKTHNDGLQSHLKSTIIEKDVSCSSSSPVLVSTTLLIAYCRLPKIPNFPEYKSHLFTLNFKGNEGDATYNRV